MRLAAVVVVGIAACDGPAHDPAQLIAERAPPGADDCGAVGGWSNGDRPTLDTARACVVAALAAPRGFHVLVDEVVSDGRLALGYAGAGTGAVVRLEYQAVEPAIGDTDEDVTWTDCRALTDRGDGCDSLARDLCLRCEP